MSNQTEQRTDANQQEEQAPRIKVPDGTYRIERFEQRRGSQGKAISVLTNLETGQKYYIGHGIGRLQSPEGVMPVNLTTQIEASSLQEAFAKFEEAMKKEAAALVASLQRRIVVPKVH